MNELLIFILVVLAGGSLTQLFRLRASVKELQRPFGTVDERLTFPALVTLTINRPEIAWVQVSGVYDAIEIQRNPYALECRLTNSTGVNKPDPFSFFVPRDQTVLQSLGALLLREAERLDREGNPFFK